MSQINVHAQSGGGGTGILYVQGDVGGQVGADANNTIYLIGSSTIEVSGNPSTNSLTFTQKSNYAYQIVTNTTTFQLSNLNAYISKGSGAVNFILPPSANVGDTYKIVGYGNLWKIQQNAGQKIVLNSSQTTTGVTGYVQATVVTDQIEIVCVTANTEFYVIQVQGNPSFN